MNIFIDNKNGTPIYDQIYTQIKAQIISGSLPADSLLPSIRSLAKDLCISVITTRRAYDELENEGFIYTVAGKGCFVSAQNKEFIKEQHLRQIESHMQEIIKLSRICALSREDVFRMFELMEEEE